MNYSSLTSLNNLKNKFVNLLQKAINLHSNENSNPNTNSNLNFNSNTNTNSGIYTPTSNIGSLMNNHDYLNSTSTTIPSKDYIQILTNKIAEMDDEIAYLSTLNKQQKYRLKQLNKQINLYLLNINVI